jgi:PAS domain S-box-containing protein
LSVFCNHIGLIPYNEHFLTSLLDASPDGIMALDRDLRYTAWNRTMERLSGFQRDRVLGQSALEIFPFLREIGEDQYFSEALAGKPAISRNRPFSVPETSRAGYFEGHYFPQICNGKVVGVIGIIREMTEQKRAEGAAREALQRLTFHVQNTPLAVVEWDNEFRVSLWSEGAERLFGWNAREILGKRVSDWNFVVPEDLEAVESVRLRQRDGMERQGVICNRNFRKDGSIVHCEWYNSVLSDEDGNLVSVLSLVLDVTARKRAETERNELLAREREARKHAEEADRLKDEFLATLSHELRTPLTAIFGWASILRNGEVPDSEFPEALAIIERNARAQARLVDELLDVSRIITGNLQVDLRPIDMSTVVELASNGLRPAAQAKNISLEFESNNEGLIVRADQNRLRQVVWNLILNAIKFTPRGGRVTVRTSREDQFVRIVVQDNGEGISEEFLPHVFDRFRQAEGSISRKQGGLGLGLAVVRHLTELHGGVVSAESEGPGRGATFSVTLPLVEDDSAKAAVVERGESAVSKQAKLRLQGLRVLIVEDDDDSRSLLAMMLKRNGADVSTASSSGEALSAIKSAPPDVLVSDIGLPGEDGYELIRKVQEAGLGNGRIRAAIALTGYAGEKDRERALAAGYSTHLAKPVEPIELVTTIAELMGKE